jgi:two-component system OmpR family sensor kinase/two-component system sensor histidine kinase BaeS
MGYLFGLFWLIGLGAFTGIAWLAGSALGVLQLQPGALAWAVPVGIFAITIVVGSLVFTAHAVRRATLPIGDLLEAAGRVAEGDYSARVDERGPREVRTLAHAFNSMAGRLQVADEQRRDLLADVTHELRTPLTVIQGNLEGLIDGVYPADEAHLKSILDETRVLSRLVDDLRTLALAESGALVLKKEPTDVAALVSEAVASFRAQADAAGVTLSADVGAETPTLEIDPARMREVLANLIANALHYTPRGGSIRVRGMMDGGANRVILSVGDTGAGIAPEDLPRIFDRFYRARNSLGMGLGLAIARNLVAAHGGEIVAESEPGKGTTIRFWLPGPHP